jgi:pentatricopeptide repeat protein
MPRLGRAWRAAIRSIATPVPGPSGPSTHRHFHASSYQSFQLFWWKSTPQSLAKEVTGALVQRRPQALLRPYNRLVELLDAENSDPNNSPLSHEQLLDCMELLSHSKYPSDYRLLRRMFYDAERLFGHPRRIRHYYYMLLGMTTSGHREEALEWLKDMRSNADVYPGIRDYDTVLDAYADATGEEGTAEILRLIREDGHDLGINTYNILIKGHLARGHTAKAMAALDSMREGGIEPDIYTLTTLLDGLFSCGDFENAEKVKRMLLGMGAERIDTVARNVLVKLAGANGGFEGALKELREWRRLLDDGGTEAAPNEVTVRTLVQVESTPLALEGARSLLRLVEEEIGVFGDPFAYSILLLRVLSQDVDSSIGEALEFYEDAKNAGVVPDVAMLQTLIHRLTTGGTPDDDAESIKRNHTTAKALYEDLVNASSTHREATPDIRICNDLLFSCSRAKDVPFSFALLESMETEGIAFDARTLTNHAVALMKASGNYLDAFNAYSRLHSLDKTILDRQGFHRIISTFLDLPNKREEPTLQKGRRTVPAMAPAAHFIELLVDMRYAGIAPDTVTYTLVLKYYTQAADPDVESIRRIHDIIKLDTQHDPDIRLLNTLMRAYSLAGDHIAALNIWQMLLVNPALGLNAVSVDIALDTCGHAGLSRQAHAIWHARRRDRFPLTKKNWDTWVECLGRLREFAEASKVVFEEMGTDGIPAADSKTFAILFSQLRLREGPLGRALEQTRDLRPEIWEQVKESKEAKSGWLSGVIKSVVEGQQGAR